VCVSHTHIQKEYIREYVAHIHSIHIYIERVY